MGQFLLKIKGKSDDLNRNEYTDRELDELTKTYNELVKDARNDENRKYLDETIAELGELD